MHISEKCRDSLESALKECLVGRWFYFVFKSSREKCASSLSVMASSIRLAEIDRLDYTTIYDYLVSHANSNSKLNYSSSSNESIVDDTILDEESLSSAVSETAYSTHINKKQQQDDEHLFLNLEKLKIAE